MPVVDAVVVGGGPAGLSAALVLGRARKRVLVLDTGKPANANVQAVGGLLGQRDTSPFDLRGAGRDQLAGHPNVEVRDDAVADANRLGEGFAVKLGAGGAVRSRTLVLAHGLRYDPPPLPGIEKLWGRSVFHCPFCDGWEVRDRPLAVHGNGPEAAESALFISNWSRDVVLCTDGPARLNGERALLANAGVRVREEPIRKLAGSEGRLDRVEFLERAARASRRALRAHPPGSAERPGRRAGLPAHPRRDDRGRRRRAHRRARRIRGRRRGNRARPLGVANAIGSGSRVAYAAALDLVG